MVDVTLDRDNKAWLEQWPQVLTALAARRNSRALPELPKRYGLRLPGRDDCLLEPGYAPSKMAAPGAGACAHLVDG